MGKSEKTKDKQSNRHNPLHDQITDARYAKASSRVKTRSRQEDNETVDDKLTQKILTAARKQLEDVEEEVGLGRKRVMSQEDPQLSNFCPDSWTWNPYDKSPKVKLLGEDLKTARFHPDWSNGTAGVRGTRVLNRGRYYWEIEVRKRIFGTSMMFGVCTKKTRMHVNGFVNMLGEDEHSWGLSHKGWLWHNSKRIQYAKSLCEKETTTIGLLFDGVKGTLSYYKDGIYLGVAFRDLHLVQDALYPVVCSTAAKTEMALGVTKLEFINLQDRCRSTILALLKQVNDVSKLSLPNPLKKYIMDGAYIKECDEKPKSAV